MKAPSYFLHDLCILGFWEQGPDKALEIPSLYDIARAQLGEENGNRFYCDFLGCRSRRAYILVGRDNQYRIALWVVFSGANLATTAWEESMDKSAPRAAREEAEDNLASEVSRLGEWLWNVIRHRDIRALRELTEGLRAIKGGKVDDYGMPELQGTGTASALDLQVLEAFTDFVWEHKKLPTKRQLDRATGFVHSDGYTDKEARVCRKRLGLQYLPEGAG